MYVTIMIVLLTIIATIDLAPMIPVLSRTKRWSTAEVLIPLCKLVVMVWVCIHLGWTMAIGWPA